MCFHCVERKKVIAAIMIRIKILFLRMIRATLDQKEVFIQLTIYSFSISIANLENEDEVA